MATIIVVDDDEDMRMLVEFKLVRMGHDIITANDGLAGLEACRHLRPDLAIIDVNMPIMSGIDLVRHLRASVEHRTLPIIMLTALCQESDVAAGMNAGATDYVTKPFSPAALAARVDALLPTRRDLAV